MIKKDMGRREKTVEGTIGAREVNEERRCEGGDSLLI